METGCGKKRSSSIGCGPPPGIARALSEPQDELDIH
jgi:hypothetical protein